MKYMFEIEEIDCCGVCPIADLNQYAGSWGCYLTGLGVDPEGEMPDWCPLTKIEENQK